ncbi:cobalamin biosynthesis protein CbiX [Ruficoccus amylovorans]|uniref:Cobalamin biosynthesis protein CbiX n=1 Tax=Ruficoccus amylovorans TaxID=1804625 RepID=A0A842HDU7_9BACT|nr:cobalamin biosynthesis protein CbiX [Ruficoccus amylovorans]MBC2594390.1 cobalamin biosynthesis protein CbiX [Ruficoccus amylovorans]
MLKQGKNDDKPVYLLVDNGSLRPEATLSLRELAVALGSAVGEQVHAVSLQHSDRVDPERLGGKPAWSFVPFIEDQLKLGKRDFRVVPLFLGPSRALTVFIPAQSATLQEKAPDLCVTTAPCLCPPDGSGDEVVAGMLARAVHATMAEQGLTRPRVALVDHGSPIEAVTQVRDRLAAQVGCLLGEEVELVAPCSMERREGVKYDFNEPLLEKLLVQPAWREASVVVSMLFLQPGRHAGAEGDVAGICARAEAESPALKTFRTALLAEDPALIELLVRRLRQLV